VTTGFDTDDFPNGALAYVYEGPGAGEVNYVEDYDHDGHANGAFSLIFHRQFDTALTTDSAMIVLAAAATTGQVLSHFGRADLKDSDEIDCSDGVDDGDLTFFAGYRELRQFMAKGHAPVVNSNALYI